MPARAVPLIATALILLCSPAESQWEVTPGVGLYLPLGSVISVDGSAETRALDMRQLPTPMAGVRIARGLGFASVELAAEYTPSLVAVRDGEGTRDISSGMLFTSARFLAPLVAAGPDRSWNLRLGAGLGLLRRWGEAWEEFTGTTDLALATTVAAGFDPRRLPVEFRLEVTDYLYDAKFGSPDGRALGAGTRTELMWLVGVSLDLDFDGGRTH